MCPQVVSLVPVVFRAFTTTETSLIRQPIRPGCRFEPVFSRVQPGRQRRGSASRAAVQLAHKLLVRVPRGFLGIALLGFRQGGKRTGATFRTVRCLLAGRFLLRGGFAVEG